MANHVQGRKVRLEWGGWLALLLAACCPLWGEGFSHRVHLAKKLECITCHSAANSSTKASDNLIPKPELCATCHTGEMALQSAPSTLKPPRTTNVSKFSHQLHAKLGNTVAATILSAIQAGTYLDDPAPVRAALEAQPGRPQPCTGCHRGLAAADSTGDANYPRMADCLTCHNKIDPPFSCEKCHESSEKLKPPSHTTNFLDRHSDKSVAKVGCAVCHGRRFTCLGCH